MIYIMGDTHGQFGRIEPFYERFGTSKDDVLYWEEEYPSLLFVKDGEVFDLDGKQAIVIGGAYNIDKMMRLMYGYSWWQDEQPSDEIKRYVENRLDKLGWKVDVVLSHTMSLKYE